MPFYAYTIRNLASDRVVYCGITTRAVALRWKAHKSGDYPIGRAIRKYGKDAFEIAIVAQAKSPEDLMALERIMIAQWGTLSPGGYNLTAGGEGLLGFKQRPESIAKMKSNLPDRHGKANSFFGRKHSAETLKKISGENSHAFGKPWSDERRASFCGERNHNFGRPKVGDTLKKMREAQSGPKNHNFGKPWSAERRAKQEAAYARKNGGARAVQ